MSTRLPTAASAAACGGSHDAPWRPSLDASPPSRPSSCRTDSRPSGSEDFDLADDEFWVCDRCGSADAEWSEKLRTWSCVPCGSTTFSPQPFGGAGMDGTWFFVPRGLHPDQCTMQALQLDFRGGLLRASWRRSLVMPSLDLVEYSTTPIQDNLIYRLAWIRHYFITASDGNLLKVKDLLMIHLAKAHPGPMERTLPRARLRPMIQASHPVIYLERMAIPR